MRSPKISVVLTARNYGRYLDASIQSVLAQTCQDFELIVVDDGSADDTEQVLAPYKLDPRVRVVRLEGVGLAAACNRGIAGARGSYVVRLDADDYFDRDLLSIESGVLDSKPEVGMVYSDYWQVDEGGRLIDKVHMSRTQIEVFGRTPLAAGAMYRRSCWEAIGGYDERLRYQEDYDFWLRFTARYQVYGITLPLLYYRQHGRSMSRNLLQRAAARRYVKRRFVESMGRGADLKCMVVIPAFLPWNPQRDEAILSHFLGGTPLLSHVIRQARAAGVGEQTIVVSSHPEVLALAARFGAQSATPDDLGVKREERVDEMRLLAAATRFIQAGGWLAPQIGLCLSPYYPLRHDDRLREAIDTLLIQGADLVVSVDGKPTRCWPDDAEGPEGAPSGVAVVGSVYHEAGGIVAARTEAVCADRSRRDVRVACLELLPAESLLVSDSLGLSVAEAVLDAGLLPAIQETDYLRTV